MCGQLWCIAGWIGVIDSLRVGRDHHRCVRARCQKGGDSSLSLTKGRKIELILGYSDEKNNTAITNLAKGVSPGNYIWFSYMQYNFEIPLQLYD